MRVLNPVMLGLRHAGVARQAVLLPQACELPTASGQHLVHIALVPRVEDDRIVRRIESEMQRQGQFDNPQVGTQVTAGAAHVRDQELPDLGCQLIQLWTLQRAQVAGLMNRLQQGHGSTIPAPHRLSTTPHGHFLG
ncbi:hypothetical protein SDC9_133235 [bioreactor metagenome]|uniref:Uncharacterized protein n=1 Tax=bioreactor metagenome TaxID=1076179 RepID=A0A645DC58_9ZZZZ